MCKGVLKTIKQFIVLLVSNKDIISSKRFMGILCMLVYILVLLLGFVVEISQAQLELTRLLLYFGAGLLGITGLEKFKDAFK